MKRLASCVAGLSLLLVASDALAGAFLISEFRLRGPNGAADEFIEIYNNTGADHVVDASSGTGYGVAASDGILRATIPNGTVIPNHGHYLIANAGGYSLGFYPAGSGTTAMPDATYTMDIPDNAGIAIFETNVVANFSIATRLDAVGSTTEGNTLYKEGSGYPALGIADIEGSFFRLVPGTAVPNNLGGCRVGTGTGPVLVDSGDNASDFLFVNPTYAVITDSRLGAPGPENLSSPIAGLAAASSNTELTAIDTAVPGDLGANADRNSTSDPANSSTFGTIEVRRKFTNETGAPITRLRFRVIDITTFPAGTGFADLRPRSSGDLASVPTSGGNVVVRGTTVEQPPAQPNGGGFNSTFSVSAVSPATPLASGASINVRFLLGVQQQGSFPFFLSVETLPADRGLIWGIIGNTESGFMEECPTAVVAPAPTTTTLTSSPNPSTFGQAITMTAVVAPAATGTITFFDGMTALGTATLNGSSRATRLFSNLDAGTHSLTAQYGGDPTHAASTSAAVSQVINPASTSITLVSSLNPSVQTQSVTFTVTVTPASVSGTVSFFDNSTLIATPAVVAGKATWTVSTLAIGTHAVTARYDGSANYLASAVASVSQAVQSGGGGGGRGGAASGGAPGSGGAGAGGRGGATGSATGGASGSGGGVAGRGGASSGGAGGMLAGTAGMSGAGGTAGASATGGTGTAGAGAPGSGGVIGTAGVSGQGGAVAGTGGASAGGAGGNGVGGGTAGATMVADGGVDGPGAGGNGGAGGAKGGADASTDQIGGGSDDGCSCATTGSGSPSSAGVLLVALGAMLALRRRRERR